ncbi:MAG: MerR family transcriptional regulator [Chitinophagaceae bacterium]|nr:MerR family transcriptional regulator [Chitinophagaceae bacterium]
MNVFTIKDLENLSGIKAHTIRMWEQRYNFLKPKRTCTNIRCYCNDELRTLLNIALLNKYGFKISHIDKMKPEEIREKILSLGDIKAQQERVVNELVQEMAELNMEEFEKIMGRYVASKGIERTVTQIIFPFLEKIGILWQTGHIIPAQEHLVANIIRQKLIAAIETASSGTRINKTVLLFLPEGEYHEMGLLFVHYILKSKGICTIYLGANVPLKDVECILKIKKPDLVFIHLTGTAPNFHLDKFMQNIEKQLATETIISGYPVQHYKKKLPSCVQLKRSLAEVMEYLAVLA